MLEHWLKEFWRQGYSRKVPGLPLALTRVLMGIFWFSQLGMLGLSLPQRILSGLVGVLLALGLLTKLGALLGIGLTILYVAQCVIPFGEPLWPYVLLAIIHLLILATGCGRSLGIDQMIVEKLANWPGKRSFWMKRLLALF